MKDPYNTYPFKTFHQVIDRIEYLEDVVSPFEVSPGTDLCVVDTMYSLDFLTYLHSFGKLIKKDDKWFLNPKLKKSSKKPYRDNLIQDAVDILESISKSNHLEDEIKKNLDKIDPELVSLYLQRLPSIYVKGKVIKKSEGWDTTYALEKW